ncbi:MAG TPA: ribonuclease HI family protein [Dehalococcoidia bacterium]|nr:ribonuclease HI family protein [Dehalococcoidia bacterium]
MSSSAWVVQADGASRGNPGPAAIGYVVWDEEGRERAAAGRVIGVATNNEAEYRAAIAGLEAAVALGAQRVELRLDSELVVRQLEGRYRVRNPALGRLHGRLRELAAGLEALAVRHVPRGENRRADALANAALDRRASGG